MVADPLTKRSWVTYFFSLPYQVGNARRGMRRYVLRKIVYDSVVAKYSILSSIFKDVLGLETHTTERVIELPLVESILMDQKSVARCIEVGCGDSSFMLRLARKGLSVVGIDIHSYPFAHKRLEFVKSDTLLLPFKGGSFDLAYSISSVEHVGLGYYGDSMLENGDEVAIREIRRILRPGGLLVLTVPFGSEWIPGFERVYDSNSVAAILGGFEILDQHYWAYDDGWWKPVPVEKADRGPPLRGNRSMAAGVAVVTAKRSGV